MGLKHRCIGQSLGIEKCEFHQKYLAFVGARLVQRQCQAVLDLLQAADAQPIGGLGRWLGGKLGGWDGRIVQLHA